VTVSSTVCEVCGGAVSPLRIGRQQELDRCGSCGHLMRDVQRSPAGHRAEAWGGESDMDRVRSTLTYRRVRALAPSVPGGGALRVFDAGFGSGGLLRHFLDDGADVAGADPGSLHQNLDPVVARSARLVHGPVDAVEEGHGTYDLVLAVHVIEHVHDPWAFAAGCRDLARSGGRVVMVTPAGDGRQLSQWGAAWWMLEDPTHVRFFSAESLHVLLSGSGLVDVRVQRPLADSLAVEAASLVRRRDAARSRPQGAAAGGALSRRSTRLLAAASLPLVIPIRSLAPLMRPSLQAVAVRP
jgi:SAM-dependent methyltransferase